MINLGRLPLLALKYEHLMWDFNLNLLLNVPTIIKKNINVKADLFNGTLCLTALCSLYVRGDSNKTTDLQGLNGWKTRTIKYPSPGTQGGSLALYQMPFVTFQNLPLVSGHGSFMQYFWSYFFHFLFLFHSISTSGLSDTRRAPVISFHL